MCCIFLRRLLFHEIWLKVVSEVKNYWGEKGEAHKYRQCDCTSIDPPERLTCHGSQCYSTEDVVARVQQCDSYKAEVQ